MAKKRDQLDIVVDDRKLTIHVLRVRDSGKVDRMREAAKATPVEDPDVQTLRVLYYPVFAACTTGDKVPTEEEFLDMPNIEGNKWFDAVAELNPGLFPKAESEEKKES